ncbi:hypothetical protein GCM10010345_13580 [Streptomyces canarius]|uniref:Uncharacterized protein n=1 Tax=Streptomyces canarius TaxID=285453 RepID=A0ABQ3CJF7_9ACTN|nr:hypothetical protein GCM10010345_13580 [Streptomyces canarius]
MQADGARCPVAAVTGTRLSRAAGSGDPGRAVSRAGAVRGSVFRAGRRGRGACSSAASGGVYRHRIGPPGRVGRGAPRRREALAGVPASGRHGGRTSPGLKAGAEAPRVPLPPYAAPGAGRNLALRAVILTHGAPNCQR